MALVVGKRDLELRREGRSGTGGTRRRLGHGCLETEAEGRVEGRGFLPGSNTLDECGKGRDPLADRTADGGRRADAPHAQAVEESLEVVGRLGDPVVPDHRRDPLQGMHGAEEGVQAGRVRVVAVVLERLGGGARFLEEVLRLGQELLPEVTRGTGTTAHEASGVRGARTSSRTRSNDSVSNGLAR